MAGKRVETLINMLCTGIMKQEKNRMMISHKNEMKKKQQQTEYYGYGCQYVINKLTKFFHQIQQHHHHHY